jgi:hypothetical protein
MDRLQDLLPAVLRKRGLHGHAEAALVVHNATRWIAERLPLMAADLHPVSFRDGTLLIHADQAIAAQECCMASEELLSHLRLEMPDTQIESIRTVRSS